MAGYIRQSSFSDGDTITAALFNNEFNQTLNAFSNTGGHKHDGTAAEGPVIGLIGDAGETAPNNKVLIDTTNNFIEFYVQVSSSPVQQLYIADGAVIPVTDNDIDLGTSSLEFKDGYFDGTLYADAINFNGTAITSTAAELNILDGVTSTAAELNILDGVTSTAAELNILDGVTSTAAELNILDGVTASAADINLIDGITNGTVIASKAIVTDANIDITGGRNITISGELDAATLDISGDADIDGTLEADAITIAGVTLAETISDTVGAMVSSNTESGITVAYDDADNTLDFTVGTLNQNTTGSAATLTTPRAIAVAGDVTGTANFDGSAGISITTTLATDAIVTANITNANVTLAKMATNSVDSDQYVDGSIDLVHMSINSVDSDQYVDGSIDTAHIADDQITLAKMAGLTRGNVIVGDASGNPTALAVGTSGYVLKSDGTDIAWAADATATALTTEEVQDIAGAMFSSNTESGITATYQDADGTIDLTVGTLNQNTTGTAATVTEAAQSNITSLGTLTTLTVDNVIINGSTIGHTGDTDLITVASGIVTVAGEVSMTTLDIGGTNVTATAAELNYVDGVTSLIQTQLDTKATTGKAIAMALVFG